MASVNANQYNSYTGACYVWSLIKVLKIYHIFKSWQVGKTAIQQYYDAMQDSVVLCNGDTNGLVMEKTALIKPDRAIVIAHSTNLFKLEVSLICANECSKEVYALIAHDNVALDGISDRIYYKTYYQASKFHGQIQLDLVRRCNDIIHKTHVAVRDVLGRCSTTVSLGTHASAFARLAFNLNLRPAVDNGAEKCSSGKHWEAAGFQGEDPSTDFRGVGELGLQQLDYFCQHHPLYAQRMIQESGTLLTKADVDQPWYPFALCGIHVTKLVCTLLEQGILQRHLLQAQIQGDDGVIEFINTFYSFCFVQCHLDWAEGVDKQEIRSVFQFEEFFADFSAFLSKTIVQKEWQNDDFHPHSKWW